MRRRALLRNAALVGAAGIAGCTSIGQNDQNGGGGDGGDGDSPTDSPTDSSTDSPTDSPTPATELTSESFEVTSQGCGEGTNTVDISFEDGVVTLEGVIDGSNGCYTAKQESAVYDAENDRLEVNVVAYEREKGDDEDGPTMCTQCIVDIEYEARYEFAGEEPKSVSVSHDGRGVSAAAHGESSASAPADDGGSN
jgi:hypothetical protein